MDSTLVLFDCTVFKTPFAHHSLQYFSVAHATEAFSALIYKQGDMKCKI